eukprot:4937451-Pleurochrysis_carterae.AAC.3
MGAKEKRRTMAKAAERALEQSEQIVQLQKELKVERRAAVGAVAECERRSAVAEELRLLRAKETACVKRNARKLSTELDEKKQALKESNSRLAAAESRARASALKLLSSERTATQKDVDSEEVRQQLQSVSELYAALQVCHDETVATAAANLKTKEEAERAVTAKEEELAAAQASSAKATAAAESATAKHDKLKDAVGIIPGYDKVPDASFQGDATKAHAIESWSKKSKKFVHSALDGRLETANGARAVAKGIVRAAGADGMARLVDTPEFVSMQKAAVESARDAIYSHWTSRLSVHIWDRLALSRSQMEMLRHLLSFVFNPHAGALHDAK